MRVRLGWTFALIVLSGMMLFTHSTTSYIDSNGILHEPFFFFVPLTYSVLGSLVLFWGLHGMIAYVQRHRTA
ncbi:DUF3955 domain-containing protein [Savagea sp. SN6]|uniref:DUF3955 domain-containing protein n=1 Tax=Savagea serpentis TaxID=2785297 RepID=A0A8J7G9H6_9BACL|nr:DUF3955 domain-containing protein [Savagea serpentis]MBF4500654.1 DUF3955 domain-containing protein [Savagea serpentis]